MALLHRLRALLHRGPAHHCPGGRLVQVAKEQLQANSHEHENKHRHRRNVAFHHFFDYHDIHH